MDNRLNSLIIVDRFINLYVMNLTLNIAIKYNIIKTK